jgi:flavodoxin I
MKKVMVAYDSRTGRTEKMAGDIAEGIRSAGHEVRILKISDITDGTELEGYDAYLLGAPTYFKDTTSSMKEFLFKANNANLQGKVGGAFGSYTHIGNGPRMIYDTMEHVFEMNMGDMNPFNVKEQILDAGKGDKACKDFGKAMAQKG